MNETDNKTKSTNTSETLKLNLEDVAIGIRKLGWVSVVLALVVGLFVFIYRHVNYVPQYTTEATFTVSTQSSTASVGGVTVYSFYYDASTANQLADTFPYILQSNLLYEAICEDLDVPYLNASLSSYGIEGSNMFTLRAVSTDPELSYDALVSAIENYPKIVKYAIGNIKLEMITAPAIATDPANSTAYIRPVIKLSSSTTVRNE